MNWAIIISEMRPRPDRFCPQVEGWIPNLPGNPGPKCFGTVAPPVRVCCPGRRCVGCDSGL